MQSDMKKLPEVETAKALMTEAVEWSVFKWLWEKSKVREVADDANAALDSLNRKTKKRWNDDLREAYRQLVAEATHAKSKSNHRNGNGQVKDLGPEVLRFLRQVKESDDKAYAARMDAEATFDDAEKQLNTSLAREGCKKAIHSWNLHEKAIRAAEALIDSARQ
jgi:hypothetical protein